MSPPDLERLLTNNTPPNEQQINDIRELQRTLHLAQCELLNEICNPDTTPERGIEIQASLEQIDTDLSGFKIILAPIRHIHADILGEIFTYALWMPVSQARDMSLVRLCRVSSLWRSTAIRRPWLWTMLYIAITSILPRVYARIHFRLHRWLERAGQDLPLSIRFENFVAESAHNDVADKLSSMMTSFLTPFSERIRRLDLGNQFSHRTISSFLRSTIFVRLETLIVRGGTFSLDDEPGISMPLLSRLKLHRGLPSSENMENCLIPWRQLTEITLNDLYPSTWHGMITSCRTLQRGVFFFSTKGTPFSTHERFPLVCLPFLQELTLTYSDAVNPHAFQGLEFPALETLRLGSIYSDKFHLWTGCDNFYTQIARLRELYLVGEWPIDTRVFQAILEAVPDLLVLELEIDREFEQLFVSLTDLLLVPRLQSLSLDVVFLFTHTYPGQYHRLSLPHLQAFVESRNRVGSHPPAGSDTDTEHIQPLQKLILHARKHSGHKDSQDVVMNQLARMSVDGLTLLMFVWSLRNYSGWRSRLPDSISSMDYA